MFSGCQTWEETRDELALPINVLVHKEFPQSLKAMDPEATARLVITAHQDGARELNEALVKGFSNVEFARCRIDGVAEVEDGFLNIPSMVCLEGKDKNGNRKVSRQLVSFVTKKTPAGWKIVNWNVGEGETSPVEAHVFNEEATLRGLNQRHKSRGVEDRWGFFQDYLAGSGLSVRDVDGDSFEDVLVVNGASLHLYRNNKGHFEEITQEVGLEGPPKGESRIGIFGDIDNDGDSDLFVGVTEGSNYIYINENGRFQRRLADELGIISSNQTTSACFADFDQDGLLDLYVANGMNLLKTTPDPIFNAKNGTPNQIFRNLGQGKFEEVSSTSSIADSGWALSTSTVDYDNDGDLDLFVANDFGRDVLYKNLGGFKFEDVTIDAGLTHFGSSMGAAFSDVDGDGDQDLFVSGMASGARWMLDLPEYPLPGNWVLKLLFSDRIREVMKEMLHGNRFYVNQGDGSFKELSTELGMRDSGWAWGGIIFDYDNDGLDDVYVLNGFKSGKDKDDL